MNCNEGFKETQKFNGLTFYYEFKKIILPWITKKNRVSLNLGRPGTDFEFPGTDFEGPGQIIEELNK